jgi:hypothetical protein
MGFRPSFGTIGAICLLVTMTAACRTGESEAMLPPPGDPVLVEAAPETKDELGIERWGVSTDPNGGDTVVRGYGAKNEDVVELRHHLVDQDANHGNIEISLSGSRGAALMRLVLDAQPTGDAEGGSTVTITSDANGFAESPDAQKVLDRMSADVGTGVPEVTPTVSLLSEVHPLDGQHLTEGCDPELLQKCAGPLLSAGASAAIQSSACRLLARDQAVILLCQGIGSMAGGAIVGTFGVGAGAAAGLGVGSAPGALLGGAVGVTAGRFLGGVFGSQVCTIVTGTTKHTSDCAKETWQAMQKRTLAEECAQAPAATAGCGAVP